jgi:hypothetical protein
MLFGNVHTSAPTAQIGECTHSSRVRRNDGPVTCAACRTREAAATANLELVKWKILLALGVLYLSFIKVAFFKSSLASIYTVMSVQV